MKLRNRRNNLLVEPPGSATGDIAFNLIVFFLVCASVQPDSGRKQVLPRSEEVEQEQQDSKNIEVEIVRNVATVTLNGDPIRTSELKPRLTRALSGKANEQDRIVIVKSKPDATYDHWIYVTGIIEEAGGIITMQTEEEREVIVN